MQPAATLEPSSPPGSPPTGTAAWTLRLLGAVRLTDAQGHAVRLPSRAVALLLARLAMAPGRQHPREELVELLWPGVLPEVGRNRLRQALSVLRSLLEPQAAVGGSLLQADRRAVWLSAAAVRCDAVDFQQALRLRPADAAALYGGELLPGYFDEWVQDERRSLAEAAATVAATPAHAAVAVPQAQPGTAPRPEPPQRLVDSRLPAYLTRMVGFEADGAALAAAVQSQRLVLLRGPGGAGKTRLAVEVAQALAQGAPWVAERGFDLIAFVALAACTSAAQLREAVLHAVQPGADAASAGHDQALERALAGRRALLLLDNFEQLVDAGSGDVARWLARLPQLHLLVTSRRALGLDGEVEHALAPLPLPRPGAALREQALNPAMTLFVDRARAARADFHLTERNHVLVAELVHALHGLPLAIELAAARVRSLGLAEMHRMLAGEGPQARPLELLSRPGVRVGEDARHASMLAVLAWSWRQLSDDERALLSLLAVCDGGCALALAARLAGCDEAQAVLLLDALVSASVVYRRETAAGLSRFHIFEPMRDFVAHEQGAGMALLRARHAAAVAAWAAGLGREPPLAQTWAEWPNLARALASAADPAVPGASAEQGINSALDASHALDDLTLSAQALDSLRRLAELAPQHRSAVLQALLARQSFQGGQGEQASRHAQAALAALPDADAQDRPGVLRSAAHAHLLRIEKLDDVQQWLAQALAGACALGQHDVQARTLVNQALLLLRQQGYAAQPQRLVLHRQALALWRRHGPQPRVVSCLLTLALQEGGRRKAAQQLLLLQEVRDKALVTGQLRLLALALSVTGYALADLRRYEESAATYRQCLQMDWERGDWREWFYVLWNLPRTLAGLGQADTAARLMGFAEAFGHERFGKLGIEDLVVVRRTRRYLRLLLGPQRCADLWAEGAALGMSQAQQLALAATAHLAGAAAPGD